MAQMAGCSAHPSRRRRRHPGGTGLAAYDEMPVSASALLNQLYDRPHRRERYLLTRAFALLPSHVLLNGRRNTRNDGDPASSSSACSAGSLLTPRRDRQPS